jgi:integrase
LSQILALLLSANPNFAKQLRLQQLENDPLFDAYLNELKLRQLSSIYVQKVGELLNTFKGFLNNSKPTPELAETFLAGYFNHKPNTRVRYFTYVQGFMTWYGFKLSLTVKAPRLTPPYYTDAQINKLLKAANNKKTHKHLSVRDSLIIELATCTGLRRSELANLKVSNLDFVNSKLQVVNGKGGKTRTIPLLKTTLKRLRKYCEDKNPQGSLLNLKPACISNKIRLLAKKAGVDIHTHSLRHYFGTKLVERGANIRAVQELMGHSSLNTTQVYIGVTAKHLEKAISLLRMD